MEQRHREGLGQDPGQVSRDWLKEQAGYEGQEQDLTQVSRKSHMSFKQRMAQPEPCFSKVSSAVIRLSWKLGTR